MCVFGEPRAAVFTNGQIERLSGETVVTEDVVEFMNIRLMPSHERNLYPWFTSAVMCDEVECFNNKSYPFVTRKLIWKNN